MEADLDTVRSELRQAIEECTHRGLLFASKWAAEQLCNLVTHTATPHPTSSSSATTTPSAKPRHKPLPPQTPHSNTQDIKEADTFSLAKCYFDLREFARAAHYLTNCTGPRAVFLRLYSQYLCAERIQDSDKRALLAVRDELEMHTDDAFCLYLYSLVTSKLGLNDAAHNAALQSVRAYAYNWSAWQQLEKTSAHVRTDTTAALKEVGSWVKHAFLAQSQLETHNTAEDEFDTHTRALAQTLDRTSPFMQRLQALRHYNQRAFEDARVAFSALRRSDPFSVELSDVYSNVLYVLEDSAQLGALAHACGEIDRFRPETCCVIGNYYSLRREHEKAVGYFERALRLDREYLAAWTLMGHEYIELKNTSAAIAAYRGATRVDARDYRAWYGLGQTYEMLNMFHYAVEYYKRSCTLRPYDARMWGALAGCYEHEGARSRAVECYRRAVACGEGEGEVLAVSRLAKLHADMGDTKKAAYYYQMVYERGLMSDEEENEELARACLFLAVFEQERGDIGAAKEYLAQVVDSASACREEAQSMMRALLNSR